MPNKERGESSVYIASNGNQMVDFIREFGLVIVRNIKPC